MERVHISREKNYSRRRKNLFYKEKEFLSARERAHFMYKGEKEFSLE
jgi:hypothetical protein